jgi:hypothetical protein
MLLSNPECHSVKFFWHLAGSLLAASFVDACTLSDYNYLGTQRDSIGTSVGGIGNTDTMSLPSAGNSGGVFNSTGGRTLTGLAGGAGAAANSAVVSNGGTTAGLASGGATQVTSTVVVAGGGVNAAGGTSNAAITALTGGTATAGGGNTAGSSAVAGGGVATGGLTNSSVTTGGVNTGGFASASGGSATGGIGTGGFASLAVVTGGVSAGGVSSSAGTGGASPPSTCPGCAVLQVPFTASGQIARFFMLFPSSSAALTVNTHATSSTGGATSTLVTSEGTMKLRVYAPLLGNTQYKLFVQQDTGSYTQCFSAAKTLPTEVSSGWCTLEWGLGACTADTAIGRLGLELITDTAVDASTPSRTTLWVDSIQIDLNGNIIAGPFTFDTSDTINPSAITNDYEQTRGVLYLRPSGPTPPSGSTISWRGS